jgi:hypothetical protein
MPTLADRPDLERVSAEPDGAALLVDHLAAERALLEQALRFPDTQPVPSLLKVANAAWDSRQAIVERIAQLCAALAATRGELRRVQSAAEPRA